MPRNRDVLNGLDLLGQGILGGLDSDAARITSLEADKADIDGATFIGPLQTDAGAWLNFLAVGLTPTDLTNAVFTVRGVESTDPTDPNAPVPPILEAQRSNGSTAITLNDTDLTVYGKSLLAELNLRATVASLNALQTQVNGIASGGGGGGILPSIGTTKGDILAWSASGTPTRLAVGTTNSKALFPNPSAPTGIEWRDITPSDIPALYTTTKNAQNVTSYVAVAADVGKLIVMTSASNSQVTLRKENIPVGQSVAVLRYGTGAVDFVAGAGTIINSDGGLKGIGAQFAAVEAYHITLGEFILVGKLVGASAGPAPFSPNDISGLTGWYKADSLALNNSDPIASWSNSATGAGALSAMAQSTATKRPTYQTNAFGSLPAALFNPTNVTLLQTVASALPVEWTVFCVAKQAVQATGQRLVAADTATAPNRHFRIGSGASLGSLISTVYTTSAAASANDSQSGATDVPHIVTAIRNNTATQIFHNGASDGSTAVAATTSTPSMEITMGGRLSGTTSATQESWNGLIAELLFFNRALNTTEQGQIKNFLASKYAITVV